MTSQFSHIYILLQASELLYTLCTTQYSNEYFAAIATRSRKLRGWLPNAAYTIGFEDV
jgi:hypothetical protein